MTRRPVSFQRRCDDPDCGGRARADVCANGTWEGRCRRCGKTPATAVHAADWLADRLTRCWACGGTEFFVRKDFPQKLGLWLVIVFGLAATLFFVFDLTSWTYATLAGLVVVDLLIYPFVGRVTVCYRCRAEYRRLAYNPDHKGFDLATSEKYG